MPLLVLVEIRTVVSQVKLIRVSTMELAWDCGPSKSARSELHFLCT